MALVSSTVVESPSDAAYTAVASPAGPPPTTATSTTPVPSTLSASRSRSAEVSKKDRATSRTDLGASGSRFAAHTSGYAASGANCSRTRRPISLSGATIRLGSPIRSKKSRIDTARASPWGETILATTTSGSVAVQPQSLRSSVTAWWNSSSRAPLGMRR